MGIGNFFDTFKVVDNEGAIKLIKMHIYHAIGALQAVIWK
jgi:hypothetical protein